MLSLSADGAERVANALTAQELNLLDQLAKGQLEAGPGVRLFCNDSLNQLLARPGTLDDIAKCRLGAKAQPVRAVLFDKNADSNWAVGWHQDRTIAVRARRNVLGFGPWSKKAGQHHIEPPFEIISKMLTLRAHLDVCHLDNAPLMIAPGSHCLGRIPVGDIEDTVRKLGSAICEAEAADVWAYATPILHASDAARRPTRRRVLQVDYSCDVLPGELEWLGIS
jgi:hypothetical protein